MNCNNVNTLLNRYESVLSAQMTKSLCKSVIYSNIACSVLGIGNQEALTFFASGGGGGGGGGAFGPTPSDWKPEL